MAKAAPKLRKTLSQANLVHLGAERLAGILMDATAADPTLKRSLRLEIAAELGAEDLAEALGKRMDELASSRARISWRKRPELLRELSRLRGLIVDRLAEANPTLGFASLVAWVDLLEPLQDRTKDPRGELPALFATGADDVARLAGVLGSEAAVPVLFDAVATRASVWSGVIGAAAVDLDLEIARGLLASLTRKGVPTSGRLAPVIRRLADRTGAVDPWLESFDDRMRRDPAILVEATMRLAKAGRAGEAREALEAALVRAPRKGMGWRAPEPPPQRDEAWHSAEIAVLDAEGRDDEAMLSRWARFERLLTTEAPARHSGPSRRFRRCRSHRPRNCLCDPGLRPRPCSELLDDLGRAARGRRDDLAPSKRAGRAGRRYTPLGFAPVQPLSVGRRPPIARSREGAGVPVRLRSRRRRAGGSGRGGGAGGIVARRPGAPRRLRRHLVEE